MKALIKPIALILLLVTVTTIATAVQSQAKGPKTWLVKVTDDGGGAFSPINLNIRQGQRVHWRAWDTWNDQPGFTSAHNVTLDQGPKGVSHKKFSSNPIGSSSLDFTRRLVVRGEYHFICSLHSGSMFITVNVRK